jgi:hypothetical protein
VSVTWLVTDCDVFANSEYEDDIDML